MPAARLLSYTVGNNNRTVSNLCVKISWLLLLYSLCHSLLLHVWGWTATQPVLVLPRCSSLMTQKWGPVEIMLSFNFRVITSQIKHCKTNCHWLCVLVCVWRSVCLRCARHNYVNIKFKCALFYWYRMFMLPINKLNCKLDFSCTSLISALMQVLCTWFLFSSAVTTLLLL